ncbi:hypothetical protein Zmor_021801 [Zophobas morio]|uniref:Uncharacterized protein n=1 Tax=Zophobas morio TaxID=2755281 RepID=A0AA38MB82_9CUCU|nr:hypothetical protein Zmor_021801 [Zophobas morio]
MFTACRASALTTRLRRSLSFLAYYYVLLCRHKLIKITDYTNTTSLKPYLKVDQEHHQKIVDHMQGRTATQNAIVTSGTFSSEGARLESEETANKIVYNNCTFQ